MKTLLLLSFILVFSFLTNAQECDFLKNDIDPFTGEIVKVTSFETLHSNKINHVSVSFANVENTTTMIIILVTIHEICFKDDETFVIFLDADNNRLKFPLTAIGNDCGEYVIMEGVKFYNHTITTIVPEYLTDFVPEQVRFVGYESQITITRFIGENLYPADKIFKKLNCVL